MSRIDGMDFIQMRNGSFYVSDIKTKTITVTIDGLPDPLKLKTSKIAWIIFRNPYGYAQDRVQLVTGSELRGTVTTKQLTLDSSDLGKLKLDTSAMLTAHFASNHDFGFGDPG